MSPPRIRIVEPKRGSEEEEEEERQQMDAKVRHSASVTNVVFAVRCTEEVLLPSFTDESLHVAMENERVTAAPRAPELRLVLLGRKGAGKSSAGNTILEGVGGFESGKPTEECVKRQADVGGRRVTIVDTPGWEWYYPLNSTPDWVRGETLRSVTLCLPGPHALLLVVRSRASVTEAYLAQIEGHLESLGKDVWEHTIVLFTRGDELGLGSMEQRILTSGKALQKLVQMCGNRYHVLDNRSRGDGGQVRALVGKMEEMVAGRRARGGHFVVDNTVLMGLEADKNRRVKERRKKQRQLEEQMQRGTMRAALLSESSQASELDRHPSFSDGRRRLSELRLVLLGERETGKSSVGNAILGGAGLFQTGTVTEECARGQTEVAARLVVVVDTPGWEGGGAGPTPERVKREVMAGVSLCPPGPHAVLLTLRVDTEVRAGPVIAHLELLGEGVWRHTLLLFTHGDQLRAGVGIERHIQSGGRDLHWLLEKCGGRYHVLSCFGGGGDGGGGGEGKPGSTQVTELLEKVEKMAAGNRCEAFSGLVREVGDLSRERNERFEQCLTELRDRMLRQEGELRKMREREAKSIRRFFERKRKIRSPGKADVEKEGEEDDERRSSESTNEVEERMRWLLEEKEREVQDVSAEHDRIQAELHRSCRERQEVVLKLERREVEVRELNERIEEQQLKVLDLERDSLEMNQELKQREQLMSEQQEWAGEVERLRERIERCENEKTGLSLEVEALKSEMGAVTVRHENSRLHFEREEERRAREKEEAVAETERRHREAMERRMREKETEVEKWRRAFQEEQAALEKLQRCGEEAERTLSERVEEMRTEQRTEMHARMQESEDGLALVKQRHKEEIVRKVSQLEKLMDSRRTLHQDEIDRYKTETKAESQRVREQHADEMSDLQRERDREVEELKRTTEDKEKQLEKSLKEIADLKMQFATQVEERRQEAEKEKERIRLNYESQLEQRAREKQSLEELNGEHANRLNKLQESLIDKDVFIVNHKKETELRLEVERRTAEEMKLCVKKVEEQLAERERDNLDYKRAAEEHARGQQREIEELLQHVQETNEKLQRKEEETLQMTLQQRKEVTQELRARDKAAEEARLRLATELNEKLRGKESEIEEMRQLAEHREAAWRTELSERDEKGGKECDGLRETVESKSREIAQVRRALAQRERELEEAKELCAEQSREIKNLEEGNKNAAASVGEMRRRHAEQEREKDAKTKEILQEREAELNRLKETEAEREREVTQLSQTMEQTKLELKELTGRMEREMMSMIQEYEKEITGKDATIESILKEKETAVSALRQTEDYSGRRIVDITDRYEQSQESVKELHEQNENIRKQLESIVRKFEEQEREIEADRAVRQSREEDIRELANRYEEQAKAKDAAIQDAIAERNQEVNALNELHRVLQREMGIMRENEREGKRKLVEMEALVQRQLVEKRDELDVEVKVAEERFADREKEVKAREQGLNRQEKLNKRLHELTALEEDVARKEGRLESREEALTTWEESLEKRQKEQTETQRDLEEKNKKLSREEGNINLRAQNTKDKEQELEGWLQELENKQKQLNCHGQDLQTKVKELKDWGKELEGKEEYFRNREQELLNRSTDLETQSEELKSKRQQLDDMLQNLAKVQQELYGKEKDLKESMERLLTWEQCSKKTETEMYKNDCKKEGSGFANGRHDSHEVDRDECFRQESHTVHRETSGDVKATLVGLGLARESHLKMFAVDSQEVGEEEWRSKESDRGARHMRGQREETASSATGNNSLQFETTVISEGRKMGVQEKGMVEGKEGAGSIKEGGNEVEAKVTRGFGLSPHQHRGSVARLGFHESELRILVLGEAGSPRCSTGVTILGRELSGCEGTAPGPWISQIAGRRVSLVEPQGLRWRNGPLDSPNPLQRDRILQSISVLAHQCPDVVLLVIPAYLTCTQKYRRAVEEHVSLLGEEIWQRALVLFTWGETLGESAEQHILRSGDLTELVRRCGGRYHVMTGKENHSLMETLLEKMEEIVALND